jgi:hypothetical protein
MIILAIILWNIGWLCLLIWAADRAYRKGNWEGYQEACRDVRAAVQRRKAEDKNQKLLDVKV